MDSNLAECIKSGQVSAEQVEAHYAAGDIAQPVQPEQPAKRNFCETCGKRLGDIDSIHTCTPPGDMTDTK